MFYTLIVGFDGLFEIVGAIFVCKVRYHGYGLVGFHLGRDLGTVHHYLCVKNLLVNAFIEGVETMSQGEFIKTSYRENGELCYWTIGYQLGEIVELDKK